MHFIRAQDAKAALDRYKQLKNEGKSQIYVSEFRYKKEAPHLVQQNPEVVNFEKHWAKQDRLNSKRG